MAEQTVVSSLRTREAAQDAVAHADLDAFLVVSPANLAYVSGFRTNPMERLTLLVVTPRGPLRLLVPALEEEAARAATPADTVFHVWEDQDGPAAALQEALADVDAAAGVGIEKRHLSVASHELLASLLPDARFEDCGEELVRLRLVKSLDEVEHLRRASGIVDRAVGRLVAEELRPGRTELELAGAAARLLREEGGEELFDPLVLGGPRSAMPHGHPGADTVKEGELLIVDIGATSDGYWADITRTFVLGGPTPEQQELFDLVNRAREAGIDAIRPGVRCADVDRAARSVIADAGHGDAFIHRLGHGLGLEVHEGPDLNAKNEQLLEPGMVVTVEPGVYLTGTGGVRIEDDVLVTADGAETLTRAPIRLSAAT